MKNQAIWTCQINDYASMYPRALILKEHAYFRTIEKFHINFTSCPSSV